MRVYHIKRCEADCEDGEPCPSMAEGRTSYCAHHNRLFRKAEETARKDAEKLLKKLSTPKKIYSPPKKVSDKRKELNHEYISLANQFKLDNPTCAVRISGCTKSTDDVHHRRGRGKYLLEVSTWLAVCRNCHIYIENHPEEAKERGCSESRLAKEFIEPHKI